MTEIDTALNGEESQAQIIAELRAQLKETENELAISQGFFENCPMALIAIDAKSKRIRLWNRYATTIFGYTENDALGEPLSLIAPPEIIGGAAHAKKIDSYMANDREAKGMGGDREFQALTKSGKKIDIQIKVFPLNAGEILFIGAAAEDVSKLRQAAHDLEVANHELKENRQKLETAFRNERAARNEIQERLADAANKNATLIAAESAATQKNKRIDQQGQVIALLIGTVVLFVVGPMVFSQIGKLVDSDMVQTARDISVGLLQILTVIIAQGLFGLSRDEGRNDGGSNEPINNSMNVQVGREDFPSTYDQPIEQGGVEPMPDERGRMR